MTAVPAFRPTPDVVPIVLLHGLTASWRVWQPVLDRLPSGQVLVLPLPGHRDGPQVPPKSTATLDTIVDGVIAQLDAVGIDRAHLVGNSFGGWVALELARRGRAVSVVALSPAGVWTDDRDARRLIRLFNVGAYVNGSRLAPQLAGHMFGRKLLFGQVVARPERIKTEQAHQNLQDAQACTVMSDLVSGVRTFGPIRPFVELPCPVTLVWGERDAVIPYDRYGKPMVAGLPGATVIHIPGVGHVPMGDDPRLVADTITSAVPA